MAHCIHSLKWLSLLSLAAIVFFSCADDPQNSPPFAKDTTVTIEENTPAGEIVTTLSVNDAEGDPITFDIFGGNTDDAFEITAAGQLIVANQLAIDFEINPEFNLGIILSDGFSESRLKLKVVVRDDENEDLRPLTTEELQIMNYFTDIALGFEFGNAPKITRQWVDTMRLYASGDTSKMLIDELNLIIDEINDLTTDEFHIIRTNNEATSNMHVYMGAGADYAALYPTAMSHVDGNWGLFFVNFDSEDNIDNAHMYVDTERADDMAQRHLLREELTQSLGLARDANDYPNSIFYQPWTTVDEYAEIDEAIIALLYHPDMTSGLDENGVRSVIANIFRGN